VRSSSVVEEAVRILRRLGWDARPAPSSLLPLGVAVVAKRLVPKGEGSLECPECGGPLEVVGFAVEGREELGLACPACRRFGLLKDAPRAGSLEVRLLTLREALALVREWRREARGPVGSWAGQALEEALDRVRRAPKGERNVTLAREAARVGRILASHPVWTPEEALERLVEAALEAGLGRREAEGTARRQLRWGMESPGP